MQIREIHKNDAIPFIQKYHYSKILPRLTKHYLGTFDGDKLIGVITLGWGTQPLQTITKIFYKHKFTTKDYFEIGKMCFLPEINKSNSGSQIMSTLVKWVKENTETKFLYTLADGIMGKCGYVYQASNFQYIGKFSTSVYMDKETKEKMHPRSAKHLLVENAERDNKEKVFWLTHDFCEFKGIDKIQGLMFRYMYPLSKKSKKILKQYPEYQGLKNPKNGDLKFTRRIELGKFEEIEMPDFNMDIQVHNYQKYSDNNEKIEKFFKIN